MVLPFVIPLWGKILALSLAKKITVVLAARYYGFPRLYRKCQKTVRWLFKNPARRDWVGGYVRAVWRIPDKILYRFHNRAVKAAGVPQASLPRTPLVESLHRALSVERLFPGSNTLAARARPALSQAAPVLQQGPAIASPTSLRNHHKELQEHKVQLKESRKLASSERFGRFRTFGRQKLESLHGRVRYKLQDMNWISRRQIARCSTTSCLMHVQSTSATPVRYARSMLRLAKMP